MSLRFPCNAGYGPLVDFMIPKAHRQAEPFVQTSNRPSRDIARTVVLGWVDTKEVRQGDAHTCALRNDAEQPVVSAVIKALRSYEVRPVVWSQREELREELAA